MTLRLAPSMATLTLVFAVLGVFVAAAQMPFAATAWSVDVHDMGPSMASVLSPNGALLFNTDGTRLFAFDLRARSLAWTFNLGYFTAFSISLIPASEDQLLVGAAYAGGLINLNTTTGQVLWINGSLSASLYSDARGEEPGLLFPNDLVLVTLPATEGINVLFDLTTATAVASFPVALQVLSGGNHLAVLTTASLSVYNVAQQPLPPPWIVVPDTSLVSVAQLTAMTNMYVAYSIQHLNETTGLYTYTLRIANVSTGKSVLEVDCAAWDCGVTGAFFPDGHTFAFLVNETAVRIVDLSGKADPISAALPNAIAFLFSPVPSTAFGNAVILTMQTNLALLSDTGAMIYAGAVPTNAAGLAGWTASSKCIILPNLQGYVVLRRADLGVVGRNETWPDLTAVAPTGGSDFVVATQGAFIGLTMPAC